MGMIGQKRGLEIFAAYCEYQERIPVANTSSQIKHQLVAVSQLVPSYVRRCFERKYSGRKQMDADALLAATRNMRATPRRMASTKELALPPHCEKLSLCKKATNR